MDKHEFAVWSEENRRKKLEEHRKKHAQDGLCQGLTAKEYNAVRVPQKKQFAKARKPAYTSVWRHYAVSNKEVQLKYG
jgi:hypothetical protein